MMRISTSQKWHFLWLLPVTNCFLLFSNYLIESLSSSCTYVVPSSCLSENNLKSTKAPPSAKTILRIAFLLRLFFRFFFRIQFQVYVSQETMPLMPLILAYCSTTKPEESTWELVLIYWNIFTRNFPILTGKLLWISFVSSFVSLVCAHFSKIFTQIYFSSPVLSALLRYFTLFFDVVVDEGQI